MKLPGCFPELPKTPNYQKLCRSIGDNVSLARFQKNIFGNKFEGLFSRGPNNTLLYLKDNTSIDKLSPADKNIMIDDEVIYNIS